MLQFQIYSNFQTNSVQRKKNQLPGILFERRYLLFKHFFLAFKLWMCILLGNVSVLFVFIVITFFQGKFLQSVWFESF